MFELSIAWKYLVPRWRQLSVSIISIISILVIALVVWLIVVFFSVTNGLEKIWTGKLIALTAPVRVTPTEAYYQSYYFQIDHISASSNYNLKSLGEKLHALESDPYHPETDEEIPEGWPSPDLEADGSLKDIVKKTFKTISTLQGVPPLSAHDYEMTFSNIHLQLIRTLQTGEENQTFLTQAAYLSSFDPENPNLKETVLPLTSVDLENLSSIVRTSSENAQKKNASLKKSPFTEQLSHWNHALLQGGQVSFLPRDPHLGDGVLLPKNFKESGVLVGDRGYLSYYTPTASAMQEQRIPIYVAGFYDHGVMPIGGKLMIVNQEITSLIRASYLDDKGLGAGINVRFNSIDKADEVKLALQKAFEKQGLAPYWKIQTYREYDFTKDILQQLQSEKNLFTLISTIIILVACSNIISMLIILVNDKKVEIGILRSMGAKSASIAFIFGFCGVVMGLLGSIIGIGAALLTLQNLQSLINLLSRLQGHQAFNAMFYGDRMPNQLSSEALAFVIIATAGISLLAGLVPAIKASLLRPSATLRSE